MFPKYKRADAKISSFKLETNWTFQVIEFEFYFDFRKISDMFITFV